MRGLRGSRDDIRRRGLCGVERAMPAPRPCRVTAHPTSARTCSASRGIFFVLTQTGERKGENRAWPSFQSGSFKRSPCQTTPGMSRPGTGAPVKKRFTVRMGWRRRSAISSRVKRSTSRFVSTSSQSNQDSALSWHQPLLLPAGAQHLVAGKQHGHPRDSIRMVIKFFACRRAAPAPRRHRSRPPRRSSNSGCDRGRRDCLRHWPRCVCRRSSPDRGA